MVLGQQNGDNQVNNRLQANSHMKAIEIIQTEHQNLEAVLFSLEQLLELIDQGKQPDFRAFHGLLTYIDRFLDHYHHPKEHDQLFPLLLKRDPSSSGLINRLERQNHMARTQLGQVFKHLSAYEFLGDAEYQAFRSTLLAYAEIEHQHAVLVDQELITRARQSLTTADWQQVETAFGSHRDPMFTTAWRQEFAALFDRLVTTLPTPIGLGDSWDG